MNLIDLTTDDDFETEEPPALSLQCFSTMGNSISVQQSFAHDPLRIG